jgi:hypothetical protein
MTATKNTRANALGTTNLVGANQAVVNLGNADERSPASLFLCAAQHPYSRRWQDQDRQPGSLQREAGRAIERSASWPGASSQMSSVRITPTLGKSIAAT